MIVFQVWDNERNAENTTYFNQENDYSEENILWAWTEKKLVAMRAMRKKLNIFML